MNHYERTKRTFVDGTERTLVDANAALFALLVLARSYLFLLVLPGCSILPYSALFCLMRFSCVFADRQTDGRRAENGWKNKRSPRVERWMGARKVRPIHEIGVGYAHEPMAKLPMMRNWAY